MKSDYVVATVPFHLFTSSSIYKAQALQESVLRRLTSAVCYRKTNKWTPKGNYGRTLQLPLPSEIIHPKWRCELFVGKRKDALARPVRLLRLTHARLIQGLHSTACPGSLGHPHNLSLRTSCATVSDRIDKNQRMQRTIARRVVTPWC